MFRTGRGHWYREIYRVNEHGEEERRAEMEKEKKKKKKGARQRVSAVGLRFLTASFWSSFFIFYFFIPKKGIFDLKKKKKKSFLDLYGFFPCFCVFNR